MSYSEIVASWQNKVVTNREELMAKLQNFRIVFAYNSNKIENPETTYHNTREIFENGKVINFTGDIRTIFEIQNQKECFDFLADKILNREPITKELILQTHEKLMKGCYDETRYLKGERPGSFKKHEYVIGDDVGELPENVENEIDFLCNELKENEGKDPLKIATYLHLNFEQIHPFADGNGRLGRTLLNYYLMIHDYPPTIIYNEDKDVYYMALEVFDRTGQINGFEKFLQEQTEKTWSNNFAKKKDINMEQESSIFNKMCKEENAVIEPTNEFEI
jgi:Fic family protein